MATNKKEVQKKITEKESLEIIESIILAEEKDFLNISAHKRFPYKGFDENVYRFTVNIMSLDMLINLMEHPKVQNVYFNPCAAGPGQGTDGISMVYRVFVKYKSTED